MGTATAVGINNNLPARQPRVAMWTADHKDSGGVHVQLNVIAKQRLYIRSHLRFDPWNQNILHILTDLAEHRCFAIKIIVLGGNDNGLNAFRRIVIRILDGHLRFGIGPQVRHWTGRLAANVRQFLQQAMRQIQRQRHEILRFTARITEHHALVTGALVLGIGPFNSLVDVFGLLVNRAQYTTRLRLEHVIAFGIADSADYLPSDGLYIEVRTALDLARQDDLSRGD